RSPGAALDQTGLERNAEGAVAVPEARPGEADPVSLRHRGGIETQPLAFEGPMDGDREVGVDEGVAGMIEHHGEAARRVGGDEQALQRRRNLAGHERDARAHPRRHRPLAPRAARDPHLDRRVVADGSTKNGNSKGAEASGGGGAGSRSPRASARAGVVRRATADACTHVVPSGATRAAWSRSTFAPARVTSARRASDAMGTGRKKSKVSRASAVPSPASPSIARASSAAGGPPC